jgi:hypothetical protein
MKDEILNENLEKLNKVIIQFAKNNSFQTIASSEVLSPNNTFVKILNSKNVRTDDGVHITNFGGQLLSEHIYRIIEKLIVLSNTKKDAAIKPTKIPGCCSSPTTTKNVTESKSTSKSTSTASTVPTSSTSTSTSTSSNVTTTATTEIPDSESPST